jgi:ABC-type multidrug transport system ATPase subunit
MNPVAVEVRDLVVRFGDFTAVDGISFAVSPGEIFGFLGANGAGKTTAIRAAVGLLRGAGGRLRVLGSDVPAQVAVAMHRVGALRRTR